MLQNVSVDVVDNGGNGDDDHNHDDQDVDNDNDEEEEEESKYCGEKQSGAVLLPTIHLSRPHSPASE